jgi:hypothetical protein
MGDDALLHLFRRCLYLRLENWNPVRVSPFSHHEPHNGDHLLGLARLLRPGRSRGLFCKYGDYHRRRELHERGILPLSSPPIWPALDRDAASQVRLVRNLAVGFSPKDSKFFLHATPDRQGP